MNFGSDTFSIWQPAVQFCREAVAATLAWCHLLTDTQRLLLPTSLALVVLLWTKMSPPKPKRPTVSPEDEALYAAAIERWLVKSVTEDDRRAAAKA